MFIHQLLLLNESSKKEEAVCQLLTPPPSASSSSRSDDVLSAPSRLVIIGYTKEPSILSKSTAYDSIFLRGESPLESEKLDRFLRYLQDRQKAGVIQVNNQATAKLYLLPLDSSSSTGPGECMMLIKKTATSTSEPSVASFSNQSKAATASSVSTRPVSFLGGLLSKSSMTANIIQKHSESQEKQQQQQQAVTMKMEAINALDTRLRRQFQEMEDRETMQELRLEAMDKEQRYVVHDVVTDFPQLLAISLGDGDLRSVVIYRKTIHQVCLADDVVEAIRLKQLKDLNSNTKGRIVTNRNKKRPDDDDPQDRDIQIIAEDQLVAVGLHKRDRRSQETILEDIKRKKQLRTTSDD